MRQLLVLSAILVAVAVAAPGFLTDLTRDVAAEQAASGKKAKKAGKSRAATAYPTERRYTADNRGHFLLNVEINRGHMDMLVDTGASIIALNESDAAAAGIRVFPSDFTVKVSTANGMAKAAPVKLDYVAVDDVEVSRLDAIVLPDELLRTSLLGTNFLKRLRRYEVSGNTLIIEN